MPTDMHQLPREEFIERNLGLVHACAGRFKGRGIEYEELYAAGCLGLVKACDGFDTGRGAHTKGSAPHTGHTETAPCTRRLRAGRVRNTAGKGRSACGPCGHRNRPGRAAGPASEHSARPHWRHRPSAAPPSRCGRARRPPAAPAQRKAHTTDAETRHIPPVGVWAAGQPKIPLLPI